MINDRMYYIVNEKVVIISIIIKEEFVSFYSKYY